MILPTPDRVRTYAATVKDTSIASQDAATVVFADGRVVTSDVSKASDHINALGWGSRRIDVVASFRLRQGSRPRGFG